MPLVRVLACLSSPTLKGLKSKSGPGAIGLSSSATCLLSVGGILVVVPTATVFYFGGHVAFSPQRRSRYCQSVTPLNNPQDFDQ